MTDLKPCPFCGQSPIYVSSDGYEADGYKTAWVKCSSSASRDIFSVDAWNTRPIEDALAADNARLLDRALTAEARVAQLECAISDNPLESERLRALIREALYLIGQGHEPGEYAESVWVSQIVATLQEATHDSPRPEPYPPPPPSCRSSRSAR